MQGKGRRGPRRKGKPAEETMAEDMALLPPGDFKEQLRHLIEGLSPPLQRILIFKAFNPDPERHIQLYEAMGWVAQGLAPSAERSKDRTKAAKYLQSLKCQNDDFRRAWDLVVYGDVHITAIEDIAFMMRQSLKPKALRHYGQVLDIPLHEEDGSLIPSAVIQNKTSVADAVIFGKGKEGATTLINPKFSYTNIVNLIHERRMADIERLEQGEIIEGEATVSEPG